MMKMSNSNYFFGLYRWPFLLLCLLIISGCSSTTKQNLSPNEYVTKISHSPYSNIDWPHLSKTYKLANQHGYGTSDAKRAKPVFNNDVVLVGLTKENDKWKAHIGANKEGEELAVNLVTGNITLLAEARPFVPPAVNLSPLINKFPPDIHATCSKGLLTAFGDNETRNLCNSEFSYISTDYHPGEIIAEAITSLGQAVVLTKTYKVKLDVERIRTALEETKIYEHLVNLAADRYYNEFESEYKNSMLNKVYLESFVDKYGHIAQLRNHEYLVSAHKQARVFELTTADEIDKLRAVINRYEGEDRDKLLSQAKIRLQKLIDQETRKAEYARAEGERKILELKKELEHWRKNLRLGDDTFCGRIIEVNNNSTMFKLAISAKLPGYANEQWVHVNDIYQPWRGCINYNGNLTPQDN